MHTCIHAYMHIPPQVPECFRLHTPSQLDHTYMHTYMHTYNADIHTYTMQDPERFHLHTPSLLDHTCMHTYMHTYNADIHTYTMQDPERFHLHTPSLLDLSGCNISDQDVSAIVAVLLRISVVCSVNLCNNNITDQGTSMLMTVRTYPCLHVCIHTYIHTYIHIYTNTYIAAQNAIFCSFVLLIYVVYSVHL